MQIILFFIFITFILNSNGLRVEQVEEKLKKLPLIYEIKPPTQYTVEFIVGGQKLHTVQSDKLGKFSISRLLQLLIQNNLENPLGFGKDKGKETSFQVIFFNLFFLKYFLKVKIIKIVERKDPKTNLKIEEVIVGHIMDLNDHLTLDTYDVFEEHGLCANRCNVIHFDQLYKTKEFKYDNEKEYASVDDEE